MIGWALMDWRIEGDSLVREGLVLCNWGVVTNGKGLKVRNGG